jgi:hypothetical protein
VYRSRIVQSSHVAGEWPYSRTIRTMMKLPGGGRTGIRSFNIRLLIIHKWSSDEYSDTKRSLSFLSTNRKCQIENWSRNKPHVARQEGTLCVIRYDVRINSLEQSPSEPVSLSGNQEMPGLYKTRCTLPLVPVLNIRVAFKHPKFFTVSFVYRICDDVQYAWQRDRWGKKYAR